MLSSVVIAFTGSLPTALIVASAASTDMRAVFDKLTSCDSCIAEGYGWCAIKRRCGGFANKECGLGPNYFSDAHVTSAKPKKAKPSPSPPRAAKKPKAQGNDMSHVFAKLRDCSSCIGAGYGWCPMARKCGGFANRECGIGPQYFAAGEPPAGGSRTKSSARNGLWESKNEAAAKAAAESPPSATVPPASPPPTASLLYAGPASPPATTISATVLPTAEASVITSTVAAAAHLANVTTSGSPAFNANELMRLPTAALVDKILELQETVKALQMSP